MRDRLIVILLIGLLATAASAEQVLVPVTTNVAAGGRIEVDLLLANDAAESRRFDLPARLTLRSEDHTGAADLVLDAVGQQSPQVQLAPGSFHRARYAGTLPDAVAGELVLRPVDFEAGAIVILVSAAEESSAAPASTGAPGNGPQSGDPAQQAIATDPDSERFASAFSPYEPNYFSVGSRGPTNARFQVSMKFRLFNPDTKTPFLEKLYLSYSQTSIWNLSATSKPFYDSSYRPSLFFLDDAISQWPFAGSRLGFQAGLEHESNGKDEAESRSINIAFVKPTFTLPLTGNYFVSYAPKVYGYLDRDDNPDIAEYRGYADHILKVGETDGWQFASTIRKGTRSGVYSYLLDASYPLRRPTLGNLGGYLHVQYFNGYGESLLDYNRRFPPQFRIGLMITR